MTNLMKFIVFALLVASVCAVPLSSRPKSESEALISETNEPKAEELRGQLRSEEKERAEALEAADDDKSEAQELRSEEESKERAEELKSAEEKERAEELKSEEESKERAEELKSDEEREKAEELKSEERAEELKADEIKAEELKAEEKADNLKAEEFETKAEELKSEEKEKEKERERRQSEQKEKAEELKSEEKSEAEAEELKVDEEKTKEKAEELKAEELKADEEKAEEKAEHLKAKEEAQEMRADERKANEEAQELRADEMKAEELKADEIRAEEKAEHLKAKEEAEEKKVEARMGELKSEESKERAEELKSEESKEKAEELKADEKESKEKAEELKVDEEEEREKAEELKSEEKEEEKERERREAEEREKSEGEAQELKSDDDKTEGEAEELKSDEKTEGEAEELKSDEKTEGEAEELKSDDESKERAEELRSGEEEEPKERAEELKSSEERERERMRRAIEKAIEAEALEADKEEEKEKAEALKSDEPKSASLRKEEQLAAERMMAMMSEQQPAMAEALVGQDPSMIGGASNPCDVPEFKYYQPHPTESNKYYQCDPWGTFVEKKCGEGLHWDRWQLRCQEKEKIVNMTSLLPTTIRRLSDFNCTIAKFACKNGGECISNGQEFRCVCSGNFTGDMCEQRITDFDLYSEIMNGNFSIEDYIRRIMKENVSLDLSYYEQYKEVLEPAVYERLIRYLSHYKNGLVRYDTLVNSLVEDVLGDIYPDADFLRTFNISQQSVITTIRLVPNLLSYARYSSERYQEVFVQYQRVLEQLWSFLNTTVPRLRTEAVRYTELSQFFLNGTIGEENWKVLNETVSRRFGGRNFLNDTIQGDALVRDSIKEDFESIMERARVLCEKLIKFEKHVVAEWRKNPEFVYKTVAQTGLTGADEFIGIFDEIKAINMDIWGTLVSYGFWFITNVFTTAPRVVA